VKTGSSYASQSELPLTFGLGQATNVSALTIVWPDGRVDNLPSIASNQTVTIQEGRGVMRAARPRR